MKKEIFTPYFKIQLAKSIREHYSEYEHIPFKDNQGKDIQDWEYNPSAVRLDGIIEDEACFKKTQ